MAGYMYLGNKKVCPAILVGGLEKEVARYNLNNGVATAKTVFELNDFKDK